MAPQKRGLAWPVDNTDPIQTFTKPGSKVSWLYNWSSNPTGSSALPFIPMQWNHVSAQELHEKCRSCAAPAILAFNEPELPDQANMPASLAASTWISHIEPLRKAGIRCGSPGISSAPQGVAWMHDFLGRIRAQGSDVDFWAIHWYGETLGQFYDYIWSTHHQLGVQKPVWITEFAPTNWNKDNPLPKEHVEQFVRDSCNYLDMLNWVEKYAFFGAMRDTGTVGRWSAMLDGEGKLTGLGKIYRDS